MHAIVDLTRAKPGTENRTFQTFMSALFFAPEDLVECCVDANQATALTLNDERIIYTIIPDEQAVDDAAIANFIFERVQEVLRSGEDILLTSFRPSIKAVAKRAEILSGSSISYVPLAQLVAAHLSRPVSLASVAAPWDNAFMPPAEAILVLVRTLAKAKGEVRVSDLRRLLSADDRRFGKVKGTFSAQSRFVASLVMLAVNQGMVTASSPSARDNNPFIKLTAAGRARARAGLGSSIATGVPSAVSTQGQTRDETRSMSNLYIDVLRRVELGPFQEVRLAVYDEMSKIVIERSCTISTLVRDATAAVRDNRASELIHSTKPFPWTKVRSFIGILVSRVPVLLNEDGPMQNSWSQVDLPVTGLAPDWQLALDGELVLSILREGAAISLNQIPALSGALYNSRRDEYYDRTLSVISYLVRGGKVAPSPSDPTAICLVADPPDIQLDAEG